MARSEARIFTSIWSDDDFTSRTLEAQWLFMFILSQASLTLCGVIDYHPARWARFAPGMTRAKAEKAACELALHHYVVIDRATDELWVRSLIKNDRILDKPNVLIGMTKAFVTIVSDTIRASILEVLGEGFTERFPEGFPKGFPEGFTERYAKRFGVTVPTCATRRAQPPPSPPPPPSPGNGSTTAATPPETPRTNPDDENPPPIPKPPPLDPADQVVLDHLARQLTATGPTDWTTDRRRAELEIEWRYGTRLLDRIHLEETLLRCTDARSPKYLRATIDTAATKAGVALS